MGRKPKIQTRVERDTKDAIDSYVEDNDSLSQSEAVRHLIRAGLAEKGYPVATADGGRVRTIEDNTLEKIASPNTILLGGIVVSVSTLCYFSAGFLATTGDTIPALIAITLGTLTLTASTVIVVAAALAQLALTRPLRGLIHSIKEDTA